MKVFRRTNIMLTLTIALVELLCMLFLLPISANAATSDDQPNSWRYKNGQLLDAEEEGAALQSQATLQANVIARGIDVSEWQGDINWEAGRQRQNRA